MVVGGSVKSPVLCRRAALLAGLVALPLPAACSRAARALEPVAPVVVEGPPRTFWLIELLRTATTAAGTWPDTISACEWHVNDAGVLYGDYWGWCEDFAILPRDSPGYLVATTHYAGGTRGGYSRLLVLPPFPAEMDVFGHPARVAEATEAGGVLGLEFLGTRTVLRPRRPVTLGAERALVEPPPDTGHFEPGGEQPVWADVTYRATSYGRLDSRKIAGRG